MSRLWLVWLPLLYLPNFGLGGATAFGVLELSDFLIGPFLLLLALAPRARCGRGGIGTIVGPLIAFPAWALLSTVLIRERYGYVDHGAVVVGLVKLGRLVVYGTAGAMIWRRLADDRVRRDFSWSMLACGVVVAAGLMLAQDPDDAFNVNRAPSGYKTVNAVSAMMAVLLCYQGGAWLLGRGTPTWRLAAAPCLAVMVVGFLVSHGRGGWLAAIVGGGYLLVRCGLDARLLLGVAGGLLVATGAYVALPDFREELDRTLWPDREAMDWYRSGVAGIDDGARLATWAHELNALAKSPILGTGFFHRGGSSGLWTTGSHNFFLQMFLETGVVGGFLILEWFRRMSVAAAGDPPTIAALAAAFASGLSGEYYYGGLVLFNLMAIMAPVCGGIPGTARPAPETPRVRVRQARRVPA